MSDTHYLLQLQLQSKKTYLPGRGVPPVAINPYRTSFTSPPAKRHTRARKQGTARASTWREGERGGQ